MIEVYKFCDIQSNRHVRITAATKGVTRFFRLKNFHPL